MLSFKTLPLALLCSIFVLNSCEKSNHEFIGFESIDGRAWSYLDTAHFTVPITNTDTFNLFVSIRHEKEYEFRNVWLKIKEGENTSRVDVPLYDVHGVPLGKCSGSLCTQTILWKKITRTAGDTLQYSVVQNMRKDPLEKISEVGLTLDKSSLAPQ